MNVEIYWRRQQQPAAHSCVHNSVKKCLSLHFSLALYLWSSDSAESLSRDGHNDKRENAPSIVVHLLEVRLPSDSQSLMVSLVLKHMGRGYFFLFCHFPLDTGIPPSISVTAADGSAIPWQTRTNTNTECMPSHPAHPMEVQVYKNVHVCVVAQSSHKIR